MTKAKVIKHSWVDSDYDPSKYHYRKTALEGMPNYGYPSNYFFADTIRNVSLAFGSFFDEIHVVRHDENGFPAKNVRVPIKMGPRMKAQDFRMEIENGEKYYISFPNLSYSFDSISWDGERARGMTTIRDFYKGMFDSDIVNELFWQDVQPAPYNLGFSLVLNCENMSDLTEIMEQICGKFRPDNYLFVKEFWWYNKRRSLKMHLESVNQDVNKEITTEIKRVYTVTFQFKIEAYLYTPIKNSYVIDTIKTTIDANLIMPKTTYIEDLHNYSGSDSYYQLLNDGLLNSGMGTWYETSAYKGNVVTWENGSKGDGNGFWAIYATDTKSLVSTVDISGRMDGKDGDGNPRNFDTSALMGAINVDAKDIMMDVNVIPQAMYNKIYHVTAVNPLDELVVGYDTEPHYGEIKAGSYVKYDETVKYWVRVGKTNDAIDVRAGDISMPIDEITEDMIGKVYHVLDKVVLVVGYDVGKPMKATPAYDSYLTFDFNKKYWKNSPVIITSGEFDKDNKKVEYIIREDWRGGV